MVSCGGDDQGKTKKPAPRRTATPAPVKTEEGEVIPLPNYRVVNMDSILLKYNLAIDFNEEFNRLSNDYQEEFKKQNSSFTSKQESFQKRYQEAASQSVPLPSEMEKLKKEYETMQTQATQVQEKLAKMESDIQQKQMKNLQTISDSVKNFLNGYAGERGYDAILDASAAPYYDPALDVTSEVIEGLNARYNKVK